MTEAYVRVLRNKKWENVEIEHLTETEFDDFSMRNGVLNAEEGWKWAKFLARWIRENVKGQVRTLE